MRLAALELDQFRKFDRPLRVEGFAPGLNLIIGPNELGKSTLLAALKAVLFERHRTDSKETRSFQPRDHRTAPQVALDLDLDDGRYRIEKRFIVRPFARLTQPGGGRIEGDAAEEDLLRLLGAGRAGSRAARDAMGVFGVIWASQGDSLLAPEADGAVRRSLQACLEAEVGEMLGGREAHGVRARIEADLFALVTAKHERPTGRYRQVEEELRRLEAHIAEIERRRARLADELAQLEQARRQHARLLAEDATSEEPARLDALRAKRDQLLRRDEALRALEEVARRADLEVAQIESEVRQRRELREALADADETLTQAASAHDEAAEDLRLRQATLEAAERDLAKLETERTDTDGRLAGLRELEEAVRARERAHAALEAAAAEVSFAIRSGAHERVRVGGRAIGPDEPPRRATGLIEIDIEGVGRISVRPSGRAHERLTREIADAERSIEALGQRLGLRSTRAPPSDRPQLELTFETPPREDGIEPVHLELETVTRHLRELDRRIVDSRREVEAQRERRRAAEAICDRAAVRLEAASIEKQRLESRLAEAIEAQSEDELLAACAARRDAASAARAELEAARRSADEQSLESVSAEIAVVEATIAGRRGALQDLAARIDRLVDRIGLEAGEGPDEQLAEALRQREQLERERERYRREVETLGLLRRALDEAEAEARVRYLEPLARRIEPHLCRLFPGAAVRIDEALRVTAIARDGTGQEPVEELSHGTREQLAVVVRLAFAEMLADRGRPALVVLDDALVFSDDARLARMFEILKTAADKVQVLILTCRARAFEALPATRLTLMEAREKVALDA